MFKAKQISVSIQRPPEAVYTFASNPENLPRWASGLSQSTVRTVGGEWFCESPMGTVKVRFAEPNPFGVMDHDVTLPSGEVNHNPFRVTKNDKGSEVTFTLFRLPNMTRQQYERDAAMIKKDLEKLKLMMEIR